MTFRSAPIPALALALACACARADGDGQVAARALTPVQPDTVVHKAHVPLFGTFLDSATIDVDGDGTAERVDLGVSASRDERGVMNWDHIETWSVVVRDGPDSYPLFQGYTGAAAFWVIAADSTQPAAILVQTSDLTTSRGGTRLEKFVFDRSRGGYVRTGVVEGSGTRALYRGPPAYAEQGDLLAPTGWRGETP
jgi:hypothetical protein